MNEKTNENALSCTLCRRCFNNIRGLNQHLRSCRKKLAEPIIVPFKNTPIAVDTQPIINNETNVTTGPPIWGELSILDLKKNS